MNLDKLVEQIKTLQNLLDSIENTQPKKCSNSSSLLLRIGANYFFRTVTMHHLGKLKAFNDTEILLEDACWIADSGRFHNFLKDGILNEVEPFIDDIIINRASIIDITPWRHNLPREQK